MPPAKRARTTRGAAAAAAKGFTLTGTSASCVLSEDEALKSPRIAALHASGERSMTVAFPLEILERLRDFLKAFDATADWGEHQARAARARPPPPARPPAAR